MFHPKQVLKNAFLEYCVVYQIAINNAGKSKKFHIILLQFNLNGLSASDTPPTIFTLMIEKLPRIKKSPTGILSQQTRHQNTALTNLETVEDVTS